MINKRLTYLAVKNISIRTGLIALALFYLFQGFSVFAQFVDPRLKGFLLPTAPSLANWIFTPLSVALVFAFMAMIICSTYNLVVKLLGAFTGKTAEVVGMSAGPVSATGTAGVAPKRPLTLIIIAAFFMLQFFGVTIFFQYWNYYMKLIEKGTMTPFNFFTMLAFPTVAFMGGVALLLRKRMAIVFFACYFFPGLGYIIAGQSGWAGYVNVPLTFGVMVYSIYLTRKGVLK
jgi:hypothetical protein